MSRKKSSRPPVQNQLGLAFSPSETKPHFAPEVEPRKPASKRVRPENPNIDLYGPDLDPRMRRCGGCVFLQYHANTSVKYTCSQRIVLDGENAEHFLLWEACALFRFPNE